MSLILSGALLAGCAAQHSAAQPSDTTAAAAERGSILAASTPAPGAVVEGPVDELRLRFSPPARLDEITVKGPDGMMPSMIHAVGEVADYSLPISAATPGPYTVNWRATGQGREYRGSFGFTIR